MPSAQISPVEAGASTADVPAPLTDEWPQLPTETELYILPDGQIVIADLPLELQAILATLGRPAPCEIEPLPRHD
ncbi:MAG: hypothetical protein R2911_00500 [Caldilineaceae bacterium]